MRGRCRNNQSYGTTFESSGQKEISRLVTVEKEKKERGANLLEQPNDKNNFGFVSEKKANPFGHTFRNLDNDTEKTKEKTKKVDSMVSIENVDENSEKLSFQYVKQSAPSTYDKVTKKVSDSNKAALLEYKANLKGW